MALETPAWLQGGSYSARLDRRIIQELFRGKPRVIRGFQVKQRASGANFSVDVTAGVAVIIGTTQNDQGAYLVSSTATTNLAAATTISAARTDRIIIRVNDPNAGGPAGNDFGLYYLNSGVAIPKDSLVIAELTRSPGDAAVTSSMITDKRPVGEWSWTVGTGAPLHNAPDGDLYVQVS